MTTRPVSRPALLQRLSESGPARQLFHVSPATLGVGRVALALLLLVDVLRRWADLDVWYTNQGLMPNHTMLWAPQARLGWSLFYGVSELHEARFFVALIMLVYLALLVGFRTKLMQVLALVAHVSLNCRVHYLTNGGDVALSVLQVWALFLPLGRWLSVDALAAKLYRARLRVTPDGDAELVTDPQTPELFARPAPRFEWAMGALALQLAVIYFFNFIHKDGPGWAEGQVVHDVLHQDRIVTALGVWCRSLVTPQVSWALTRATLVIEAALPVALLLPVPSAWLRRAAVATGLLLHLGFAALLNLGVFSAAMGCFWLFLLPAQDLERIAGWLTPRPVAPARVYFDEDCGVCGWLARVLLAVQATALCPPRLALRGNSFAPRDFPDVTAEQVDRALLWVDADGTRTWGAAAMGRVLGSFALTRPVAWLTRLGIAETLYARFAARRAEVSVFFGLGACGLRHEVEPFPVISPAALARGVWLSRLGRAALVYVFAVFAAQVLAQNRWVPAALKPRPQAWVERFVEYAHFFQGWGMFAVSPHTDSTVVVRAVTVDGRVVDPLSERASPRSPPAITAITDRLDHDEFWCDYLSRIADDQAYLPPLKDWLLAWPKRTGNPQDQLVSFEVLHVTDTSPALGEREPTNQATRVFLRYP
jgi:hypothetical protein